MYMGLYHQVFVYGSLRNSCTNHYRLEGAIFKGFAKTIDYYYMIGLKSKTFPYVTTDKLNDSLELSQITGELYDVSDTLLEGLDNLEGHPTWYKRTRIPVVNSSENSEKYAFMYILEDEEIKKGIRQSFDKRFMSVPTGDWMDVVKK